MRQLIKLGVFFLITGWVFTSCKKEETVEINHPPVANAGSNQTVILPIDSVELNGSGTDADGTIVSYEWTKLGGPNEFAFVDRNIAHAKVKNLKEGRYTFKLKVTDNSGLSATDLVFVFVDE